ncbi:MAG: hypothetical protein WCB96_00620 [Candidatus Aminicenantales bacterium]
MSKRTLLIAAGLLLVAAGLLYGEDLKAGEAAIFYRNGDMIIDEVTGISSARHVLELKNIPEIPLNNLWMINFINTEWFHFKELELVETNQHYIFLKNGEVYIGRIFNFNVDLGHFEFASGEKFPFGQVSRIYFTRNIPERYKREMKQLLIHR